MEIISRTNIEWLRILGVKKVYLGILEADIFKNGEMKEKEVSQKNEKTSQNQTLLKKYHERNKNLSSLLCKIFRIILNLDEVRT